MGGLADGRIGGWADWWMSGLVDEQIGGWADSWMDGLVDCWTGRLMGGVVRRAKPLVKPLAILQLCSLSFPSIFYDSHQHVTIPPPELS